ncbi:hypothetical protein CL633_00935 [bacterium]|nr:hypothetical protein [bacterium]|tara:strand:+ start:5881 stop:6273 length:393 start_codon:yes stop_codon:yes gene_type:complete
MEELLTPEEALNYLDEQGLGRKSGDNAEMSRPIYPECSSLKTRSDILIIRRSSVGSNKYDHCIYVICKKQGAIHHRQKQHKAFDLGRIFIKRAVIQDDLRFPKALSVVIGENNGATFDLQFSSEELGHAI